MRIHAIIPALILLPALSVGVKAQQAVLPAAEESKTVRLNRAPVSDAPLRVHIPQPVRRTLPNGVRVLMLEDHRFPRISMQLVLLGAGPFFEGEQEAGVASTTASLLTEGTQTRTSKQIATDIEQLGASLRVGTGSGSTDATLSADGFSSNFGEWLPLVADVLLHPAFPVEELETARSQELSQLNRIFASPSSLGQQQLRKALYGPDYPAAKLFPSAEALRTLTRPQIVDWHRRRYVPQNAILVVYGDIVPGQTFPKLAAALSPWKRTAETVTLPPAPAPPAAAGVYLVSRPKSIQTNLLLANRAIDRRSADYIPLNVANNIFGGGSSGRLFIRLREEKGYTYGAYSNLYAPEYSGFVAASAQVRSEVTGPALQEFRQAFKRMSETPVSDDELRRTRHSMQAEFALTLESPGMLMGYALTAEKYGFAPGYWDRYPDAIASVGKADVQAVSAKYFNPDTLQIVAVGDPGILSSLGEPTASVVIVNPVSKSVQP